MQKQEKRFSTGHRSSFWIKLSFGIGHPQLYINCSVYVWGRAQGFQIFKRNSIISIHSKVMAFLVISLSPWSPCCPHHPHTIPVVLTSSLSSPHHPHSPQKVPMWSPWLWSPWSLWSPPYVVLVVPLVPMLSPLSPCHLEGPHIIPNLPDTHSIHPHPPAGWGVPNQ